MEQPLANKNNLSMTTNRTGSQENLRGSFSNLGKDNEENCNQVRNSEEDKEECLT
jgi:hypothetical protein